MALFQAELTEARRENEDSQEKMRSSSLEVGQQLASLRAMVMDVSSENETLQVVLVFVMSGRRINNIM